MKTVASRTTYPRVSFTLTCTLKAAVRERRTFGAKITLSTMSRWSFGTLVTGIDFSPLGSVMTPAGPAAWTKDDSPDNAVVDPPLFRAVTLTRILRPTSLAVSLYCLPVAPEMEAKLAPWLLERSHWYANVMGPAPVQVPGFAVKVEPSTIEPDIVGPFVFTGAPALTTLVALDATVVEPAEFVAVTRTRIRNPTSLDVRVWVVFVAPPICAQLLPSGRPPSVPQRTHWYTNVIGWSPVQLPVVVESV
jgi:hypothetical protein